MVTKEWIKDKQSKLCTPLYVSTLAFLITVGFALFAYYIANTFDSAILIVLLAGAVLTPLLVFSTAGEINEVIIFGAEKSAIERKPLNSVLPPFYTNHFRIGSISLLITIILIVLTRLYFSYSAFLPLFIIITAILFIKLNRGLKGHYRYRKITHRI